MDARLSTHSSNKQLVRHFAEHLNIFYWKGTGLLPLNFSTSATTADCVVAGRNREFLPGFLENQNDYDWSVPKLAYELEERGRLERPAHVAPLARLRRKFAAATALGVWFKGDPALSWGAKNTIHINVNDAFQWLFGHSSTAHSLSSWTLSSRNISPSTRSSRIYPIWSRVSCQTVGAHQLPGWALLFVSHTLEKLRLAYYAGSVPSEKESPRLM